jgi:hypothetical protein
MKKLLFVLIISFLPLSSQALIEFRLGGGVNNFSDDGIDKATNLTADFIFQPPLITDLGLGLRYETMNMDFNTTGGGGDADFDRLSFLVNYRFIDTLLYFGVISTVGIKTDYERHVGGANVSYDDKLNYTAGIEGGVHLGLISLGGELGKMWAKFTPPTGSTLGNQSLNSTYAKVFIGFGF